MINSFLPTGLKGIMVASMLAAFMNTIDTHLNCGTSYMVNDFYKPFINSTKSISHYILFSRVLMLGPDDNGATFGLETVEHTYSLQIS